MARLATREDSRIAHRIAPRLALVALAWLVAGCASTTLQSTWRDPGYQGGAFKRIFVLGFSARDVTARRVLEDVVVAKLVAGGVEAVPGWQFLANDGPADESALRRRWPRRAPTAC